MKKTVMAFLIAAFAIACAPSLYAAEPVEGYWKSMDNGKITAFWKFYFEGSELKGTIVKVPGQSDATLCTACTTDDSKKFYNKPIIGTVWMWGFKKDGDKWAKGKIVDSGTGKVYWSTVTVVNNGAALKMTGSLDRWGLAGETQTWLKSSEAESKAVK
ncbi:MAG: DUF2147 domain-containing protein [Spirochaetota bacterium]